MVKVPDFHAPRHITLDYSIENAVYSREVQHSLHNLKDSAGRLFCSFCKYLVAGGAGFLVDFSALYICRDILGLHYLPASAIGFILGLVFVYIASNRWVFEARKLEHRRVIEFSVFALIGVIGLGLTMLFMWVFVDLVSLHYLVAKVFTTGLVLIWNFGARRFILYS